MPPCGVDATSRSVIVAVKAEKVISNTALSWAITHVARPGDCILLLAVFSDKMTGKLASTLEEFFLCVAFRIFNYFSVICV